MLTFTVVGRLDEIIVSCCRTPARKIALSQLLKFNHGQWIILKLSAVCLTSKAVYKS